MANLIGGVPPFLGRDNQIVGTALDDNISATRLRPAM